MNKKRCVCAAANGNCTVNAYTGKDGKIKGMRKCGYANKPVTSCPDCYMTIED